MNIVHIFIALLVFSMSLNTKAESCINVKVQGKGQPLILIPGLMSDGSVWQESENHLADICNCSTRTIRRSLKVLQEQNLLKVKPRFDAGRQIRNDYEILVGRTSMYAE